MAVDLPAILNGRKALDRLVLELDTAKARLERAKEEEQSGSAGTPYPPIHTYTSCSSGEKY